MSHLDLQHRVIRGRFYSAPRLIISLAGKPRAAPPHRSTRGTVPTWRVAFVWCCPAISAVSRICDSSFVAGFLIRFGRTTTSN